QRNSARQPGCAPSPSPPLLAIPPVLSRSVARDEHGLGEHLEVARIDAKARMPKWPRLAVRVDVKPPAPEVRRAVLVVDPGHSELDHRPEWDRGEQAAGGGRAVLAHGSAVASGCRRACSSTKQSRQRFAGRPPSRKIRFWTCGFIFLQRLHR